MSHLATIKTEVKDIAAIKAACAELGFTFNENKTQFGMMRETRPTHWEATTNECSHSISHPDWVAMGIPLEVGLVKTATGYSLQFDEILQGEGSFNYWGNSCFKGNIIGTNGGKLMQMYGVHKASIEAKRHGYTTRRETKTDGTVRLVMAGM